MLIEREGKRERGTEKERERGRGINMKETHWFPLGCTPTRPGEEACNGSTCPWPLLNLGPFSQQTDALTTEANRLRLQAASILQCIFLEHYCSLSFYPWFFFYIPLVKSILIYRAIYFLSLYLHRSHRDHCHISISRKIIIIN